jgi:hypothetical protein
MSDDRYEMRVKKNEFAPFPFKDSYSIRSIEKFKEGEYHLNKIVESINQRLSDWPTRPTIEDVKKRLDTISKCFLFFHKDFDQAIGWGWYSEVVTYDWINESEPLPTDNSVYFGGTYVCKDLDIPLSTGLQMYNFAFRMFFEKYDYTYGYMDSWNKAPQKICHKLGVKQVNFMK